MRGSCHCGMSMLGMISGGHEIAPSSSTLPPALPVWAFFALIGLGLVVLGLLFLLRIQQRRLRRMAVLVRQLREIVDQGSQLAGLADADGRVVIASTVALYHAGYRSESEVVGRQFSQTPWWPYRPEDQAKYLEALQRVKNGQESRQRTHHCFPSGLNCVIDTVLKPVYSPSGKLEYILIEGRDVTELTRLEEHLKLVVDTAPLVLWAVDKEGYFTLSTGSGLRTLGLSSGQVVGRSVFEVYKDHPEICEQTRLALAGKPSSKVVRIGPRWFDMHYTCQFGQDAQVSYVIGVALDITELMHSRDVERRLATAVEQSAEEVILTDSQGVIQYVNPAFERVTGFSKNEAVGRKPNISKSGLHDQDFYRVLWHTILAGETWRGRIRNRSKDGRILLENVTITPLLDENGQNQGFVGIKRDVTQEVHNEESLRQAQRTEAIGKLAGGIAHDFNNILQVIHANLAFAKEVQANPLEIAEYLEQAQQAATRASGLTRQLLAFGRRQTLQFCVLDPAQVVADMIKLLRRIIGEHIQIELKAQAGLERIRADIGQLEQVILNLSVNARDAMPQGGKLSFALCNETVAAGAEALGSAPKPGRYVQLAVSDTGAGIDDKAQARIFEPFFTTKPIGQGTGLGLSVVQGVVQQHEGFIRLESKLGEGTTFRIFLPSMGAQETAPRKSPESEPAPDAAWNQGGATVLLAEDDVAVRRVAETLLKRNGFQVLVASDGREACRLAEEHLGQIRVLLFDVMMPNMGGIEAARHIQALKPGLPVVLCSGYSSGVTDAEALPDPSWILLRKPYVSAELMKTLRKVLTPGG